MTYDGRMVDMNECSKCGAWVSDWWTHDEWHRKLEATLRGEFE